MKNIAVYKLVSIISTLAMLEILSTGCAKKADDSSVEPTDNIAQDHEELGFSQEQENDTSADLVSYADGRFKISFLYPSSWETVAWDNPMRARYEGQDGYFDATIDYYEMDVSDVVKNILSKNIKTYGVNPTIIPIQIGEQEGRVIIPSDKKFSDAILVVPYPEPFEYYVGTLEPDDDESSIKPSPYNYFVFQADRDHIMIIAKTVVFDKRRR